MSAAICMRMRSNERTARFQADPGLIRQRRCASEHPFGTIKRMTAADRSSPVDLEKSVVKQRSACSPYNIVRTINLVGAATLRASLA